MITKTQVEQYCKFGGDLDKWIHSQKLAKDECLTGADWTLIEKAVLRLKLEKSGFASNEYREETKRVLLKTFADDGAVVLVKTIPTLLA